MRKCLFAFLAALLLAAGCNPQADPEAERGAGSDNTPPTASGSGAEETTTVVISPHAGDQTSSDTDAELGNQVELAAISLTAPATWNRQLPSSSFVEAEFSLPVAEGDDSTGRLTVSMAGGSIEANVERWKGQFGGALQSESQEEIEIEGVTVTLVDFTGEFDDRRGPFAPGAKKPDYRMIAAIIPIDGQLYFVKAVGPQATMDAHADAIEAFVRSMKKT